MSEPPRSLPPTTLERLGVITSRLAAGSAGGMTRAALNARSSANSANASSGGIIVVEHGDDPTVDRPIAAVVRWVGAATPSNALDYDDWYPADVVG